MLLSPPPSSSLPPVTSISECGEKGEGFHDNELGMEDTAMPKRGSGGGRDEALLCDADISELAQFGDAQINAKTRGKLAQYKRIGYSCNFREREGVARSYCKQDIKCSFEEKLHLFPHGQKSVGF